MYHNNYTLHIIIKNFQGKGIWLSVRSLSSFNPVFKRSLRGTIFQYTMVEQHYFISENNESETTKNLKMGDQGKKGWFLNNIYYFIKHVDICIT